MTKISATPEDLRNFRSGRTTNQIHSTWEKLYRVLPQHLKFEVETGMLKLDYAVLQNELPPNTITYRFKVKNCSQELDEFLSEHIIWVKW